jgi:hypothetical protein
MVIVEFDGFWRQGPLSIPADAIVKDKQRAVRNFELMYGFMNILSFWDVSY